MEPIFDICRFSVGSVGVRKTSQGSEAGTAFQAKRKRRRSSALPFLSAFGDVLMDAATTTEWNTDAGRKEEDPEERKRRKKGKKRKRKNIVSAKLG